MSVFYNIIAEGGGFGPILVIAAIMAFKFIGKIITERAAQKEEENKALEKGMRPEPESQGERRYKPIGEPSQQPRRQPVQRVESPGVKDLPYAKRHTRKETKQSKEMLRPKPQQPTQAAIPVAQRHRRDEHLPVAKPVAERPSRRPRPTQKRPAKPVAVRQPQRREPEPAKPVEVVREKPPQSTLAAALGDHESLKRAIVLSEILGKPVSLRTGSQQY
ncbi:MAG TPA: hypothetical protein ENH94_00245 [Phycisphaerales bacterium]|nr:hypothetical protein [Phycisphaerales bacterium]